MTLINKISASSSTLLTFATVPPCRRRPRAGDRKRANLLAGSLARGAGACIESKPLRFLTKSTKVACVFSIVFLECVGFSYVVVDLVCSAILLMANGPCPNDAYIEELISTKTSCFRTR